MPEKHTLERAEQAKRQGKSPSTQSGEFVREEMRHIRRGKHGARSAKQATAIGLSKARHAGVNRPPPKKGAVSEKTRRNAARAYQAGRRKKSGTAPRRAGAKKARTKGRRGRSAAAREPRARAGGAADLLLRSHPPRNRLGLGEGDLWWKEWSGRADLNR